jgi:ribonuclease P protein component
MSSIGSLRSSRDFQRLARSGRRARNDGLTVFALDREDSGPTRLGLAVSAREASAVVRNRIRRRLRAAFRELEAPPGLDVMIKAKAEIATQPYQEMVNHLRGALSGTGIGVAR